MKRKNNILKKPIRRRMIKNQKKNDQKLNLEKGIFKFQKKKEEIFLYMKDVVNIK